MVQAIVNRVVRVWPAVWAASKAVTVVFAGMGAAALFEPYAPIAFTASMVAIIGFAGVGYAIQAVRHLSEGENRDE